MDVLVTRTEYTNCRSKSEARAAGLARAKAIASRASTSASLARFCNTVKEKAILANTCAVFEVAVSVTAVALGEAAAPEAVGSALQACVAAYELIGCTLETFGVSEAESVRTSRAFI